MSARLSAAGATVLAVFMLCAGPADGYEREKSETTGGPLYWPGLPLTYTVNDVCAGKDLDEAECLEAVGSSFAVWTQTGCASLAFLDLGETARTDVGYIQGPVSDNINIVIWQFSGWAYGSESLGLTTLTYVPSTGVVVDADIELNGQDHAFRVLSAPDERYTDIGNTLTHEVGHFIGLDHVNDSGATMYARAHDGEISKRVLSADDVSGVCAIYPGDGAAIVVDAGGAADAGVSFDGGGGGCACGTIRL